MARFHACEAEGCLLHHQHAGGADKGLFNGLTPRSEGQWYVHSLCGASTGASTAAEVSEDPLVKLDTTYVDLILAMETMFPATEAGGPETATSASLHPIEEDAQLHVQHAPAIEPLTVPTERQPEQPVVDSHSPNV